MTPAQRLAVDLLHAKADVVNDSHDHDELHAAGAVMTMISGGVSTEKDLDYIKRWLMGLA